MRANFSPTLEAARRLSRNEAVERQISSVEFATDRWSPVSIPATGNPRAHRSVGMETDAHPAKANTGSTPPIEIRSCAWPRRAPSAPSRTGIWQALQQIQARHA